MVHKIPYMIRKILVLSFAALMVVGCNNKQDSKQNNKQENKQVHQQDSRQENKKVYKIYLEQDMSCLGLGEYIYSDGGYTFANWAEKKWWVLPQQDENAHYKSDFLLWNSVDEDIAAIKNTISSEFGEPFADHITKPEQLRECATDMAIFAMPNDRDIEETEMLYWWKTDTQVVRMYACCSIPEVDMPTAIVITLYDLQGIESLR